MEENPYFKKTKNNDFFDDEAFGFAKGQLVDIRKRFLDRLACAQHFDMERFEALILWLKELKKFHDHRYEPMEDFYFDDFLSIKGYLEIQSKYSTNQKEECTEALTRWEQVITDYPVAT
jgi:hypothetical protein